jgi:hypothetical protein
LMVIKAAPQDSLPSTQPQHTTATQLHHSNMQEHWHTTQAVTQSKAHARERAHARAHARTHTHTHK